MKTTTLLALAIVALVLPACSQDDSTTKDAPTPADEKASTVTEAAEAAPVPAVTAPDANAAAEFELPADTIATAFGKGSFERTDGKLASFELDVNFTSSGKVGGRITYTSFLDGGKVDLDASVNCGHFDMATHRAWVGGVITTNRSDHSDHTAGRFAVGQPVWFRFEESETHPEPAAQVSDLRFAGDDGFEDAAAFCEARPWTEEGLADLSAQGAVIIFALPDAMPDTAG